MVDTSDEWIVERTGIHERRVARKDQPTSDLAERAARMALENAGVKAEELDLIIVATMTPDRTIPSTACILQDRLGAAKAGAFDLSAACSGFSYAAATACQFIETGVYRHILVVGAETLSKVLDWTDRNTCILFGDGAGAAVFGPVEASASRSRSSARRSRSRLRARASRSRKSTGSCRIRPTRASSMRRRSAWNSRRRRSSSISGNMATCQRRPFRLPWRRQCRRTASRKAISLPWPVLVPDSPGHPAS